MRSPPRPSRSVIAASAGDPGVLQDELHRAPVVVHVVLHAADLVPLVGVDVRLADPAGGAQRVHDLAYKARRATGVTSRRQDEQRGGDAVEMVDRRVVLEPGAVLDEVAGVLAVPPAQILADRGVHLRIDVVEERDAGDADCPELRELSEHLPSEVAAVAASGHRDAAGVAAQGDEESMRAGAVPVSYTHLTLPTKRIV